MELFFLCQPRHSDHPLPLIEGDQSHPLRAPSLNRDIHSAEANNFSLIGDDHQFILIHDRLNPYHISGFFRSFYGKNTGPPPILNSILRDLSPFSIPIRGDRQDLGVWSNYFHPYDLILF